MVYSPELRQAFGDVHSCLESAGICRQSQQFAEHGEHVADADAPLVMVACSGGRDSLALAVVAGTVCASLGARCGAIVIDHRLQSGSSQAAAVAADRCTQLGLSPVVRVEVDVVVSTHGEEAGARDARYQALTSASQWFGAAAVLLAHTLDDQAETVLIDLLHSTGVAALAGMPAVGMWGGMRFLRPFLGLTRRQTTSICEEVHMPWWDDPTNGDAVSADEPLPPDFPLRSRVRHTVMPFLEKFAQGGVARHLAMGTSIARRDEEYLRMQTGDAYKRIAYSERDEEVSIDADALELEHPAIRSRVVAQALNELGIRVSARHIDAVEQLADHWHGQGAVSLPSGYSANRKKHVIRVCKNSTHANR